MRIWLKTPHAILAEGAEGGIVIDGALIAELVARGGAPSAPVDETFDAGRHVILPGLVNAHHHFYQTLARAHPAGMRLDLVPWLVALYPIWARMDERDLRLSVRVALAELLLSGCTTAADHHNLFPPGLEHSIDIEVEEARAMGVRATITRGAMSFGTKDGGLPPENVVQDDDVVLADCERVAKLFHDPAPGAMTRIAFAPCSPFAVHKPLMPDLAALAEKLDVRLHTHFMQVEDEERFSVEAHGLRPVDFLESVGWLSPRVWLAHAVQFNGQDIARLGAAGVGVCHLAAADMWLAAGICPVADFEAAGAPVGLGVDGSTSNDSSNMMEAVRHSLMLQRLRYGPRVTPYDALRWATEGGAKCLGRDDIGRIAPGARADLALFKLDAPRFSGAQDPLAALVLCGAHRADRVMVDGVWRVLDGAVVGLDLEGLLAEHRQAARKFA